MKVLIKIKFRIQIKAFRIFVSVSTRKIVNFSNLLNLAKLFKNFFY